jgi:hypothetical protein
MSNQTPLSVTPPQPTRSIRELYKKVEAEDAEKRKNKVRQEAFFRALGIHEATLASVMIQQQTVPKIGANR